MEPKELTYHAKHILKGLCREFAHRPTGSAGNQDLSGHLAQALRAHGLQVETPAFDCLDWSSQGAVLEVDGESVIVFPSPYTLGGEFEAPLVVIESLAELEAATLTGQIVLLWGEIAREPLMPKNFIFYNPEEHQRIIALLEAKRPLALITATPRSPDTMGAVYPVPMFEDGDFDIPSVYMTEELGEILKERINSERINSERINSLLQRRAARLKIDAQRRKSWGVNVVASTSEAHAGEGSQGRMVLCAHFDAKAGTPGAIDNASGVTTLLLLAALLEETPPAQPVEIVLFNGEDYYAASGEMLYLQQNEGRLGEIRLAVNLDGLGYRRGKTEYSLYNLAEGEGGIRPDEVRQAFAPFRSLKEGGQWYQSDHMVFVPRGVPAVALTSLMGHELMSTIVHTVDDTPDKVNPRKLAEAALALRALIG